MKLHTLLEHVNIGPTVKGQFYFSHPSNYIYHSGLYFSTLYIGNPVFSC